MIVLRGFHYYTVEELLRMRPKTRRNRIRAAIAERIDAINRGGPHERHGKVRRADLEFYTRLELRRAGFQANGVAIRVRGRS